MRAACAKAGKAFARRQTAADFRALRACDPRKLELSRHLMGAGIRHVPRPKNADPLLCAARAFALGSARACHRPRRAPVALRIFACRAVFAPLYGKRAAPRKAQQPLLLLVLSAASAAFVPCAPSEIKNCRDDLAAIFSILFPVVCSAFFAKHELCRCISALKNKLSGCFLVIIYVLRTFFLCFR